MSIIVLDEEIEIHACDFNRCEFVTINHLDEKHIYCVCCLGEVVHFNGYTPIFKTGRCHKCNTFHIEYNNGKLEWYRVDYHREIIPESYGCLPAITTL